MITFSQLLLSVIILFIIFKTVDAYRKRMLSATFFVVWLLFWITGLILIFQQDLVISIAHRLGISRGVDLVIYLSLITLFYLIYRIMVWLNEINRKITELVREIALREAKQKSKKK